MERENLKSRLGFILLSAGCAIGIGNVWRFPYIVGNYGGGIFVLFYLSFLALIGIPVLTIEFSIGRASQKSTAKAYQELEPRGTKWHLHSNFAIAGNYILLMFYTTVAGWMLYYFYKFAVGGFVGLDTANVKNTFNNLLASHATMTFWMLVVVVLGFGVCSLGLQKGVEKITKVMMTALLGLIIILAIHAVRLDGGIDGVKFYLLPNFEKIQEVGFFKLITTAMNQAFFTLSIGMGSMMIFGSYIDKSRTLLGESINIALLDTFVAIIAGLIIFPSCFAFNVEPDSGPSLIFITLPNVFTSMKGGRIWGSLFFLFMTFAAFSTVIALFENILTCCVEKFNITRKKAVLINIIIISVLSLPCVFGFNILSSLHPLGGESTILDFEDFLVSNLILPAGSLMYLFFCISKRGWGFDNYLKEANTGVGPKIPRWIKPYYKYVMPIIMLILLVQGIVNTFI
ncbi:sodium-dependent transporter [Hominilimicola sp.]|uniref:sodium-dependent transporter n=1 Tax=Hominilimicola sp. TaxID=3073571 RepID=UPI00307C5383